MKYLILALALLFSLPASAQFAKPGGVQLPIVTLPDYGKTVSVWAFDTGVLGGAVGIFEQHLDGQWYGCPYNPSLSGSFEQDVVDAGGAVQYLARILPDLNRALAMCYPSQGAASAPPPANAGSVAQVNYALQSFTFKMVGGVAVLSAK